MRESMKAEQLQKQREISMGDKLDRIADLLEALIKMQEPEVYPPESRMRKDFIRECQRILKEIKSGKVRTRTYKNMSEFTKTLG
jgi:hypothetical protein